MRGSTNAQKAETDLTSVNSAITSLQNGKQNKLTFDTVPVSGSSNPITSGAVYDALQDIEPEPSYSLSSPIIIDAACDSGSPQMSLGYTSTNTFSFSSMYRNGKNITGKITRTTRSSTAWGSMSNDTSGKIIADLTSIIGTYTGSISISYILIMLGGDGPSQYQNYGVERNLTTTVSNGILTFTDRDREGYTYLSNQRNGNLYRMAIYQLTVP